MSTGLVPRFSLRPARTGARARGMRRCPVQYLRARRTQTAVCLPQGKKRAHGRIALCEPPPATSTAQMTVACALPRRPQPSKMRPLVELQACEVHPPCNERTARAGCSTHALQPAGVTWQGRAQALRLHTGRDPVAKLLLPAMVHDWPADARSQGGHSRAPVTDSRSSRA